MTISLPNLIIDELKTTIKFLIIERLDPDWFSDEVMFENLPYTIFNYADTFNINLINIPNKFITMTWLKHVQVWDCTQVISYVNGVKHTKRVPLLDCDEATFFQQSTVHDFGEFELHHLKTIIALLEEIYDMGV